MTGRARYRPANPNVGRLIRQMDRILANDQRSIDQIAHEAGVTREAISKWRGVWGMEKAHSPSLHLFEAVLEALGYELQIKLKDKTN